MSKIKHRKSIDIKLVDFCYFANNHDSVEVTEWNNEEGYDIDILYCDNPSRKDKRLQLTIGEIEAINECINKLKL